MNVATMYRRALPAAKFAAKILERIPERKDPWYVKATKVLSLVDAANDVYGSGRSRMRELQDRYDLVERESETFVRVFFATTLRDLFELRRSRLDDHTDLIEAIGDGGERIFFRESNWSGPRIESDFFVTPGVNFNRVIDRLWSQYRDGIYLSVTQDPGAWKKDITVCEVPSVNEERISQHARARLAEMVALHQGFVTDRVHRCYLSYGPRGTGKSSFAVLFARAFGGRALKLDATSIPMFSVRDLGFLLDTLRPKFLIIDDLDRAPVADIGPRLLFMLERLKASAPGITIVLSVNEPSKLDSALLRCGRIDIPVRFDPPERAEQAQMVSAMLLEHGVPDERRTPDVVARILDGSKDLTHAYMADLCLRLRREAVDQVLASVRELNQLAEEADSKAKGKDEKPDDSKPKG